MLSNFGNVAIAAAVLAVVGGVAGYFFALAMAGQGRKGMLANSATLAGVLVLVFGFFSLALALPVAVKLTIAGLIAWFGLALFLPSVLVAVDGEAQKRVVRTAEASAEALLSRMEARVETLCAQRDALRSAEPHHNKCRVLGGRRW